MKGTIIIRLQSTQNTCSHFYKDRDVKLWPWESGPLFFNDLSKINTKQNGILTGIELGELKSIEIFSHTLEKIAVK